MSETKEIVPGIKMVVEGVHVIDNENKVVTLTSGTYIVSGTEYKVEKAKDADPTLTIAQQVADPSKLGKPAPQSRTPMPARETKPNWS